MRLEDILHLGRPIDLGYPTNRAIVVVTGVSAVLACGVQILRGDPVGAAAVWAAWGALSVFLGWALAREVDPDGERSAFVGAGLTLVAVVLLPALPDIAAMFWALLTLRLTNRSTGRRGTWVDTVAVLGLTGWGAFHGHPVVGVLAAVALLADGRERDPVPRHLWAAGIAASLGVAAFLLEGPGAPPGDVGTLPLIGVTVATAAFGARVLGVAPRRALGDADARPLDRTRVTVAQAVALAAGWGFLVVEGRAGLEATLPLWCAILGAGLAPRR